MAQIMSVRLSRTDAAPWGFRLQGGKDFGSPLCIQKVNGGSPAERAGLQAGDAVIKVNSTEVFNLRHKDAQDNIVRAGNSFEITVQRGGSTWKPAVTPVGPQPVIASNAPGGNVLPVTKTSLASNRPTPSPIGGGYNYTPAPFQPPQQNGNVPSIVNKQYNSPVGIYSEENIAETLSAQAEVLATGVLGVNFKKNEKNYDPSNSEVLKMLNEIANEPRTPEPEFMAPVPQSAPPPAAVPFSAAGLRHVAAPEQRPVTQDENKTVLPPGQNICADCERLIVGVFVRIKNKNLHVECFKCATCGTSLKNVGYYNINNKLYCDVHAKLVARQNPPAPNLEPVTVPFGVSKPAGAISAALAKTGLPTMQPNPVAPLPSTLGPMPFHAPRNGPSHVQPSRPVQAPRGVHSHVQPSRSNQAPGGFPAAKPFTGTPSAPFSAPSNPPFSAPSNLPFSAPSMPSAPMAAPAAPVNAPFGGPAKPAPGVFSAMRPITNIRGGGGAGPKGASFAGATAPVRGRGVLNQAVGAGGRVPLCGHCNGHIRGPFVTALGKIWCPEHFSCVNPQCKRQLADIGFVEEKGQLYCEFCFEQFIAPPCSKCNGKIKGDCLNAVGKQYHPECFVCAYCGKLFGNNPFFLEDGLPYCQADWNELFTTKCFACGFPIEAGDRWVEALSNNYHSQCFNCTSCKKNLEGQSFFAKSGRPFCKAHAR